MFITINFLLHHNHFSEYRKLNFSMFFINFPHRWAKKESATCAICYARRHDDSENVYL